MLMYTPVITAIILVAHCWSFFVTFEAKLLLKSSKHLNHCIALCKWRNIVAVRCIR